MVMVFHSTELQQQNILNWQQIRITRTGNLSMEFACKRVKVFRSIKLQQQNILSSQQTKVMRTANISMGFV
jgi:hypothetical protein